MSSTAGVLPTSSGNFPEQFSLKSAAKFSIDSDPKFLYTSLRTVIDNRDARNRLLKLKLKLCSVPNFACHQDDLEHFEVEKLKNLVDIEKYIQEVNQRKRDDLLDEEYVLQMLYMIKMNVFLPEHCLVERLSCSEEFYWSDPSWPHKQVVYEICILLISGNHLFSRSEKRRLLLDHEFCILLVGKFDSAELRELEYLKIILHQVYGKFVSYRKFLRNQVSFAFSYYAASGKQRSGIAELIDILSSIVSGLALPVKPQYAQFASQSLILLHKSSWIEDYIPQLSHCMMQICQKDSSIAAEVLETTIRNWPWHDSFKQVLLLSEFEEVLEIFPRRNFACVAKRFFRMIAQILGSSNCQVAERCILLWRNAVLLQLFDLETLDDYVTYNYCHIYSALQENMSKEKPHWSPDIVGKSREMLRICSKRYGMGDGEMEKLYHQKFPVVKSTHEKNRKTEWELLESWLCHQK